MRIAFLFVILVLLLPYSCKNRNEPAPEEFEKKLLDTYSEDIKEVLYSMYLPTDVTSVFKNSGTNYNPELPASIDNISLYTEKEQIAIMLGVYGVDLTYMKLSGQDLTAAHYHEAIRMLSKKVDIPDHIFESSSRKVEAYFDDSDSLMAAVEDIYIQTDRYFRKNGDENLAALALYGGWVEAMYLGLELYKSDTGNVNIAEKILQQKFSLNNLYTILSNYQETLTMREYILMLKKLRKVFENVEIRFQKEGFKVDTTRKKLQAYKAQITYEKETLKDLGKVVPLIRNEIISIKD